MLWLAIGLWATAAYLTLNLLMLVARPTKTSPRSTPGSDAAVRVTLFTLHVGMIVVAIFAALAVA